jgi:hypothetical protein
MLTSREELDEESLQVEAQKLVSPSNASTFPSTPEPEESNAAKAFILSSGAVVAPKASYSA